MNKDVESLIAATTQVQSNVDNFSQGFNQYLYALGLPTENILIDKEERSVVINNLPLVVNRLDDEKKQEAMYISKFIAACGAGLFDAALNFLWNETIINLRRKIIRFDMNYFLDSVITDTKRRTSFKLEDDLKKMDDWELIKGCKDTGIITEIGYKHLDYIREMRNYASAAHPNQNSIDGLQISSWLQTCIKEVLAKEPQGPVLEIGKLIHNIRNNELTKEDTPMIIGSISKLPAELVDSLLSAVFGMYTDKKSSTIIRENIRFIAPAVWESCSRQAKNDTALKYATFSVNAEIERKDLAHNFLDIVEGLSYLPKDQKALDMNELINSLYNAHYAYNNFYNEPSYAKTLSKYIPETGEIPEIVEQRYVKTVVLCYLGNRYGVSEMGAEYYVKMIQLFTERHFAIFLMQLYESDIQSKLTIEACRTRFIKIVKYISERTINSDIKAALEYLLQVNPNGLSKIVLEMQFKELMKKIK